MSIVNDNIFIDGKPLEDLKVTELRSQLEIRNLSKSGVKKELYERLKNYIWSEHSEQNKQEKNEVHITQYANQMEYHSLCKAEPIKTSFKSPDKSLNLIEQQKAATEINSEEKVVQPIENDSFVSVAEETYNTAHDETQIFDDSEKKNKMDEIEYEQSDCTMESQLTENNEFTTPTKESQIEVEAKENDVIDDKKQDFDDTIVTENENRLSVTKEVDNESIEQKQSNSAEVDKKTEVVELEEGGPEEENEEQKKLDEELDYEEDVNEEKFDKTNEPTFDIEEEDVKLPENNVKAKTEEILTPEGFVRRREVSPARCKVSKLIHIHNLKRPFIVKSLKDLLSNFGNLIEDEFWIDGIKTNCIAKFETEEQAELARERLHHVVWPASSDTSLIVEYSTDEKLARRLGENMPNLANSGKLGITVTVDNRDLNIRRENVDLNSRKRISNADALPKKQLEDLFRKTNAKPHIYYLPLNENEAEKRWLKKKEEEKKRLELTSNGYRSSMRQTLNGNSANSNDRRHHYSSIGSNRRSNYSPERKRERRFSPSRSRRR